MKSRPRYMAAMPGEANSDEAAMASKLIPHPSVDGLAYSAEADLAELLFAVDACPPPPTEAGMKLAVTAAKLKERQRARLELRR